MHMISEAKEQKGVTERNETLSFAYCNSEMLLSLIHDILDFAQLKEKKLKIVVQQINVLEIVESVFQIMRVQTELKQIDLRLNNMIQQEDEVVSTDPRRVKQILINLIGNAIKFTNTGYIELSVSKVSNYYKFEIFDTGTGIQPQIITKLCQPFQTFGNEKYKNSTGVGLGLCFCKQLVGLLGPFDELFIDSMFGKGAKFGFIIEDKTERNSLSPLKNPLTGNIKDYFTSYSENFQLPDVEEFNYSIEKPHTQFCNYLRHTQDSSELIESQFALHSMKEDKSYEVSTMNVLIVDDCLFNIVVLKQQLAKLKEYEFKITQAYNGEMAVNLFKQFNNFASKSENFNIIFMDCNMPIMDGFKATEQIKMFISQEKCVGAVIVALSAQVLDQALFHFDYILSKPCTLIELQRVINEIISRKK